MNTLIIYDSVFGNTQTIVQAVSEVLARLGTVRTCRTDEADPASLAGIDLLVIGSPTHQRSVPESIRQMLARIPPDLLKGVSVAVFDTRYHRNRLLTGSAARVLARDLQKLGVRLALPPESFFVSRVEGPLDQGEIQHARQWGETLVSHYAASG